MNLGEDHAHFLKLSNIVTDFINTSVAIAVCILLLFWLLASYRGVRRSLQWWQHRQSAQLCFEAEQIRNGLLQESFAIRRGLELALADEMVTSKQVDPNWLKQIGKIQQSLEKLSDHLSPPYLEDNLSLAIRWLIEQWQITYPNLDVETNLPADWRHESIEQNRIILTTVNELLRLVLSQSVLPVSLSVNFKQQQHAHELVVQFSVAAGSTLTSDSSQTELEYLRQSFQFLTSGTCYLQRKDAAQIWYFRWRAQPHPFKDWTT